MKETRIKVPDEVTDEICELCGRNMVIKSGPVRAVFGLSRLSGVQEYQAHCRADAGPLPQVRQRRCSSGSPRRGYAYYACEKGTECGFMTWDVPTAEDFCPVCGKTMFKQVRQRASEEPSASMRNASTSCQRSCAAAIERRKPPRSPQRRKPKLRPRRPKTVKTKKTRRQENCGQEVHYEEGYHRRRPQRKRPQLPRKRAAKKTTTKKTTAKNHEKGRRAHGGTRTMKHDSYCCRRGPGRQRSSVAAGETWASRCGSLEMKPEKMTPAHTVGSVRRAGLLQLPAAAMIWPTPWAF